MKHQEALVLVGIITFMAGVSLVLFFTQDSPTGQAYGTTAQYKSIATAPYTDLPYDNEPIEMQFAGRCYRDEGVQVVYFTTRHQDVERVFDGCYTAKDGNQYYYDYYCVGTPKISQVWLKISPGC